jgi:hypothetical protein
VSGRKPGCLWQMKKQSQMQESVKCEVPSVKEEGAGTRRSDFKPDTSHLRLAGNAFFPGHIVQNEANFGR